MFLGSGSQAEYGIVKEVVSEADEAKPTTAYGKMKKQTYDALKVYLDRKIMKERLSCHRSIKCRKMNHCN